MLFEPAQFEPLTDEPWDPARVEAANRHDRRRRWRGVRSRGALAAHDWDGWRAPLPMKNL
jgi:hypothetical protein